MKIHSDMFYQAAYLLLGVEFLYVDDLCIVLAPLSSFAIFCKVIREHGYLTNLWTTRIFLTM